MLEDSSHINPVFTISTGNICGIELPPEKLANHENQLVPKSAASGHEDKYRRRSNPEQGNMTIDSGSPRWILLAEVFIGCTVIALVVLMELGIIPNIQTIGFYCEDPKIKFKFNGETISTKTLLLVSLLLPLMIFSFVEWWLHDSQIYSKRESQNWLWMKKSLRWYKAYFSGFLLVIFLADVAKSLIGEPRPHFLDTCKPIEAINCSSGYIPTYTCTNRNISFWNVKDASKSFPSGHAALSFYLFIFVACFIEKRLVGISKIIVAWIQACLLIWTFTCSLTRITDRRHHWWDVLVGSIFGVLVGQYIVKKFCSGFQLKLFHTHMLRVNQMDTKNGSPPIYTDNVSSCRLLTSTSSYNNEPPSRDSSDQSLP